jgi:hypothetical protein
LRAQCEGGKLSGKEERSSRPALVGLFVVVERRDTVNRQGVRRSW